MIKQLREASLTPFSLSPVAHVELVPICAVCEELIKDCFCMVDKEYPVVGGSILTQQTTNEDKENE